MSKRGRGRHSGETHEAPVDIAEQPMELEAAASEPTVEPEASGETHEAPVEAAPLATPAAKALSKGLKRIRALDGVLADGMAQFPGDVFVCREATADALIASGRAEEA